MRISCFHNKLLKMVFSFFFGWNMKSSHFLLLFDFCSSQEEKFNLFFILSITPCYPMFMFFRCVSLVLSCKHFFHHLIQGFDIKNIFLVSTFFINFATLLLFDIFTAIINSLLCLSIKCHLFPSTNNCLQRYEIYVWSVWTIKCCQHW